MKREMWWDPTKTQKWRCPKMVPKKLLVYNGKSQSKMDDLGLPPFQETSMWRCEILRYDEKMVMSDENNGIYNYTGISINGDMRVSINGDTPKLMVYNGNSYLNVWVGGNPILGNLHMEERGFTQKKSVKNGEFTMKVMLGFFTWWKRIVAKSF